ncbi:hypothetical protein BESB_022240 [Besnoitia besnoiti]|uniref:Transmembrane protein n=1 Tax=Besnoitia besnoiti TaxID=94643 RepID=A0A2A9M8L2_BESBE|nr:hypothetical protein BESB_022240 [Besnoitia besnoiti]PFH31732.1 hypothetical protein BESB_022240 [Besnoitia besnoiti]
MALAQYLARGVCTPRALLWKSARSVSAEAILKSSAGLPRFIAFSPQARAFPSPVSSSFARSFSSSSGMSSAGKDATSVTEPHSAYPETPLHFYRATPYSEGSINHRFFYVNLIFLLFVYDVGSAMLDL